MIILTLYNIPCLFELQLQLWQYRPASHVLHAACPCCDWYFPAGRAMREVGSGAGWW